MPGIPTTGKWKLKIVGCDTVVCRHKVAALRILQGWHVIVRHDPRPLMLRVPTGAIRPFDDRAQGDAADALERYVSRSVGEDHVECRAHPRTSGFAEFPAIAGTVHADHRGQPAAWLKPQPAHRYWTGGT